MLVSYSNILACFWFKTSFVHLGIFVQVLWNVAGFSLNHMFDWKFCIYYFGSVFKTNCSFVDPCKYFGCELGAQTQIDAKKERYIVNGSHDGSRLQELLDGFIKKFVLCPECDNPETTLLPNQKKKIIPQKCMACGYTNATVDMTHKVCTYILNHPPEMSESAAKNYASKKKVSSF